MFEPPKGILRFLARLPILLYRAGLGWILGNRFLMLHHIGRRSGKPRKVVLEVLRYEPADDSYLIASGFGEKADWYRNLRAHRQARIEVKGREKPVMASFLTQTEARAELERYAAEHPIASKLLFYLFKDNQIRSWPDMAVRFRLVRLLNVV